MFEQLGLIGCGLMGGSFALALKRAGLVKRIVGYSKSPSTTQRALQMGVIDVEAPSALLAVSGADIVMVDVGSTKRDVVDAARRVLRDQAGCFVPCHPIAGKEVSGVEHADPDLFHGKQVIITPIDRTLPAQLQKANEVWEAIGCKVVQMSPEEHDAAFAAVSHMPHLVAFALMHAIANHPHGKEYLALAGPGFRDFTRIAASDPKMWRDVLLANRHELVEQCKVFQRSLFNMLQLVEEGKAEPLEQMIELASHTRAHWRMGHPKK
jgi:prephenate dehydrogenase